MNIGITSSAIASAAGAPLSQAAGAETERAQKDAAVQQRQTAAEAKSERAAGIGETEQDQETAERDADGRRLWEAPASAKKQHENESDDHETLRQAKDPTGMSGGSLDLTG